MSTLYREIEPMGSQIGHAQQTCTDWTSTAGHNRKSILFLFHRQEGLKNKLPKQDVSEKDDREQAGESRGREGVRRGRCPLCLCSVVFRCSPVDVKPIPLSSLDPLQSAPALLENSRKRGCIIDVWNSLMRFLGARFPIARISRICRHQVPFL